MIIKLSPIRSDAPLAVFKAGDQLTINGVILNLAPLLDGASLPAEALNSQFVVGPIDRTDGDLVLTLMLPHAADAPEEARFPAPIVNVADGAVLLPGIEPAEPPPAAPGVIDWSQVITVEAKAQAAAEQVLAEVVAESAQLRASADSAIAPLQDAVDIDEATAAEEALLKLWKRYRVALSRVPEQPGYPTSIDWPVPPS